MMILYTVFHLFFLIRYTFEDFSFSSFVILISLYEPFHDGDRYRVEIGPLTCSANQWTGFYMIMASVMKMWLLCWFLFDVSLDFFYADEASVKKAKYLLNKCVFKTFFLFIQHIFKWLSNWYNIYMQSWKQCTLPVITTVTLWQLMHLGTWCTVIGLKWVDDTAKIHEFPENGQTTAFSGALFKNLGNLFCFFVFHFLTKESNDFCGFFWLSTLMQT